MGPLLLSLLPALALAAPLLDSVTVQVQPKQTVNGVTEYTTQCKTCPFNLCTNGSVPWGGENVTLTCWAKGDQVGDTDLWLKTTEGCYITEYDLVEYSGDFSADLKSCGPVPRDITQQPARVRYLSECKWSASTSAESIKYYGRDEDVTLTCWVDGSTVMGDAYWYKTTDNCHVSGSGLWQKPARESLYNCGPHPGPRINETYKRSAGEEEAGFVEMEARDADDAAPARRWLQPGKIGEEYAPCYNCASAKRNCPTVKTYEYNNTVISQCVTSEDVTYPNGSWSSTTWMLTTDWCYVDAKNFWEPPYDHYRYPRCNKWKGYE